MQRILWSFVVVLLAVDIVVLLERQRLEGRVRNLEETSAAAMLETRYAREEQGLLAGTGAVPAGFPRLPAAPRQEGAVQFVLLVSADDCTNAIEDELTKLNQMAANSSESIAGVHGYFIDEDRPERAREVIRHLSPPPAFAVTVQDALAHLPGATTPIVLVIRSRDGRILDAHKPIPEDHSRRDAFYSRWSAVLGLS
jgi:hypothetical protein